MPIDVLLLQLGTPQAPTTAALRPYLKQFLSDPRVIEGSAFARWLLVHLIIVPFRSPRSAAKYQRIWDPQSGSPLLDISRRQRQALAAQLGADFRVHLAMRYGEPSVDAVVAHLAELGCRRLVVVPMYPQYSATTTASSFDALFAAWSQQRVLPSMRLIASYHDDAAYIDAVAVGIERTYQQAVDAQTPPEFSLISFHGIPRIYVERGDPYPEQCRQTAHLVAERLGWTPQQWRLTFQSRLGRQEWLTPYTDETLKELGSEGKKTVLVAQPGFTADCLETIDEIGYEGRQEFAETGGKNLVRVECVNDAPEFIAALAGLVTREADQW